MDTENATLPAAASNPLPCENVDRGAVILWWNQLRCEREHEEFGSMGEALAELETWKTKYPWNTYHVFQLAHVHEATAEWVDPFRCAAGKNGGI